MSKIDPKMSKAVSIQKRSIFKIWAIWTKNIDAGFKKLPKRVTLEIVHEILLGVFKSLCGCVGAL